MGDANQNQHLPKVLPNLPATGERSNDDLRRAELRAKAPMALASARPKASTAVELTAKLIGAWPYGKADDPKTYVASLAAALAEYPGIIAEECCDPRTGLARSREMMPTVAAVHEWCHERVRFYRVFMRPKAVTAARTA